LDTFLSVGGIGAVAMFIDLFVDLVTLSNKYKTYTRRIQEGNLREEDEMRESNVIGRNVVEENMIGGGLL